MVPNVNSLPFFALYNFYPILTLFFLLFSVFNSKNFDQFLCHGFNYSLSAHKIQANHKKQQEKMIDRERFQVIRP